MAKHFSFIRKIGQKNSFYVYVFLTLLIFTAYFSSLFGPFIWDDKYHIISNPGIKGGWDSVINAFNPEKWTLTAENETSKSFFRPIHTLHFILDYRLWGLDPFGYHLSNTLLHLFNTFFLYVISLKILENKRVSIIGAALFAVHPVHTESITFISARLDLLCGFFLLASFYFFINYSTSKTSSDAPSNDRSILPREYIFYILSLLSFILSLLSKEMAVTFPVILLVYNYLHEGKNIKWILPYFGLLCIYILFRIFGVEAFLTQHRLQNDLFTVFFTAAVAVLDYMRLLLLPYSLKAYYTLIWYNAFDFKVIVAVLFLIISMIAMLWLWMKGEKTLLFLLVWPFLTLIPVLNIGSLGEFAIAERYLYIPSIGFCVLVGAVLLRLVEEKKWRKVVIPMSFAVIVVFTGITIDRNRVWADEVTFYQELVKVAPDSALPHANLGIAYRNSGYLDKAINEYEKAVQLAKGNHKLHKILGVLYSKKGYFEKAIAALEKAVALKQDYFEAYNHLGIAYAKSGLLDKAALNFEIVLKIRPDSVKVFENLKRVRKMQQKKAD